MPNGPAMREKPTLLPLHGGPGFDHSIYKPAYSALSDSAQIVYLDHRGNGRSEDGLQESWNLAQWGDDVRAFCDGVGIVKPVVLGASFGGMVALAYATRHPEHPSKLVLISTEAAGDTYLDRRVALLGQLWRPGSGPHSARRRFLDADDRRDEAARRCLAKTWPSPSTHRTPREPEHWESRTVGKPEVGLRWFAKRGQRSHALICFLISIAYSAPLW